jgi:hypothetical protein
MHTRKNRRCPLAYGLALVAAALALVPGCHAFRLDTTPPGPPLADTRAGAPGKKTFRVSQFVFYADFDVDRNLPLFSELADLREQVYRDLRLPSANTVVQVYLFETRERYEQFMKAKYPKLPQRRAFFVAQPRAVGAGEDLLVYTFWGERIQEDLRHELTHALLHSVLETVPLWLDEGLAEYFEVPPGWKGVNYQHLERLRQGGGAAAFHPDLARLERMDQVDQMRPAEYREAWAWVHFMLHGNPDAKQILVTYLQELRRTSTPPAVRPRLAAVVPALDATLERHLAQLDSPNRPVAERRRRQ